MRNRSRPFPPVSSIMDHLHAPSRSSPDPPVPLSLFPAGPPRSALSRVLRIPRSLCRIVIFVCFLIQVGDLPQFPATGPANYRPPVPPPFPSPGQRDKKVPHGRKSAFFLKKRAKKTEKICPLNTKRPPGFPSLLKKPPQKRRDGTPVGGQRRNKKPHSGTRKILRIHDPGAK